jgi:predicted transcriptional regulator
MNAWENAQNAYKLLPTYLQNHMNGIINGTPESGITPLQRDLINAAIGRVNADQVKANPILEGLGDRRSQRQQSIRSRRLDRIGNAIRGESGFPAFKSAIEQNKVPMFMPAAYHGTPHTFAAEPGAPFGRFRTSAIGTGEGAQAYGHGLYFAGKKEVADYYRKTLTDQALVTYENISFKKNTPYWELPPKEQAIQMVQLHGKSAKFMAEDGGMPKEVIDFISEIDPQKIKVSDKGSLYKVELAPKENEYLLYDKTLGEQTKDIQNKVRKVLTELEGEDLWEYRKDLDYRDITDNALENVPEPEISRRLKEAGIPGIKYLDGSSRSKGEGDYNYVIFDEADVQITDKLFMPAGDVMTAVNVRNELNNKFADLIVSGQKSIETRRSRSLDNLIGNRVKIVRTTGKGDEARVIGEVTIGEPIQYKTRAEFAKDYDKHLVDEDSDFAFQDGGKFGYPMINPERYDTPYPMPKRKGIVYTKEVGGPNKLFMPASEASAGKTGKGDTTPASVQSWDDANPTFGANFTKGMAKDNKEAAALLRKSYEDKFGEPIKAQDFTQEQVEWLGGMLAQEGEAALGRTGNAVNWYTSAVEKALSVAEEIFPEIGQKFEAKDRFLGALSITSQNMRVMDNAKAAVSQYQHKIRTGKFNYNIKHGAKADAITSNLKLYDKVEAKMGVKDLHAFLDEDFTVKELTEWGRDFFGDKKFSIAGYSTDKVKGSAIFGPKIGQGFFQNLRGNYDPVTVDLWLRRTYGRLTGLSLDTALSPGDIGRIIYAVRNNKGKRKFAGLEMPEFLKGVSISGKLQKNGVANFKISDKAFEALFGDNTIGRDNYEAIYEFAEKLNREWERSFAKANTDVKKAKDAIKKAKKEKRGTANLEKQLAKFEAEKVAIGKEKPQWAKAGSTVNDKLKPIDVPSNAERAVITKAFNVALKSLKDKGINLTPADLQATLWYPEKDIWAYLKGENSDALNMSYDTAMEVIRDQR